MLKTSIFSVSTLFLSLSAFAMPQVGDQATYDVTIQISGQTVNAISVMELTQFDAANNKYLQRETQKIPGRPDQVQEDWKNASDLLTDEKADRLLGNCSAAGGESAAINVPAGSFSTCVLPVQGDDGVNTGKLWMGKVPFGVIHAEIAQGGQTTVVSLHSFSMKQ